MSATPTCLEMMGIENFKRAPRPESTGGGVIVISASCSPELTREALRLEAGDFLLKPVEENQLRSAVKGILARQRKHEEEELKKEYGDCWMENHMAIKELFWKDVCLGRIRNDPEIISRKARGCNIRWTRRRYRMVLITIKSVEEVQRRWGEELCQSAIQNLAKGVVKGNVQTSQVIVIYTRVVVILDEKEGERFREIGPGLVERCRDMFGAQILCYVSGDILLRGDGKKSYSRLLRFSKDDVLCQVQHPVCDAKGRRAGRRETAV